MPTLYPGRWSVLGRRASETVGAVAKFRIRWQPKRRIRSGDFFRDGRLADTSFNSQHEPPPSRFHTAHNANRECGIWDTRLGACKASVTVMGAPPDTTCT
eukprot:6571773-Prymnesium_polylepis.1